MRTSTILGCKGYFSDGMALLRNAYELMKAIYTIQNDLITPSYH